MFRRSLILVLTAGMLLASTQALAGEKRTLCVFDPSGANGDIYQIMKDYRTAAVAWGIDFKLRPYTDEKTVSDDFKAGKCDAAVLTGTRVRRFQKFSGTVEAMGALPTYPHLKKVVKMLANPKAGKLMKKGDYEVSAIFPAGAVFLFVNDKGINSVEKLAGKRLAVLEHDKASKTMASQVGASMVSADLGTFAGMFNNKNVAMCYAPALAYEALELQKGMGTKGGVLKYPLAMVTFQVLTRSSKFSPEYGNASRKWAAANFDKFQALNQMAESKIPKSSWISVSDADKARYDTMFQQTRIRLRDGEKVYDKTMLKLLRRTRCKMDGTRSECTTNLE